jgi:hypothetical protein
MGEPVLEGEAVDEGLERRTRRAQRPREIDLPGPVLVEIIGRRDAGEDFAAGVIDGEDRDRDFRAERRRAFARQRLERAL